MSRTHLGNNNFNSAALVCYSPRSGDKLATEMRDFGISWVTKAKLPIGVHTIKPQQWSASVRTGIRNLAATIPEKFDITKLSHWFNGAMAAHLTEYSVTMSNRAETANEIVNTNVRITNIGGPHRFRVDLHVHARKNDLAETEIFECRRSLQFLYSYSANKMRWLDTAFTGASAAQAQAQAHGLTMWPTGDYVATFQVDPDTGMNKYTFADGCILSQTTEAEAYDIDLPLHMYIM